MCLACFVPWKKVFPRNRDQDEKWWALNAYLRYKDALTEAWQKFELNFPTTTSELVQQEIQAFSEFESVTENHEEEIEEEVVYEWENLDEFSVE